MEEIKNNFCDNCGLKLDKDEIFCSKCGKKIETALEINKSSIIKKKKIPVYAIVLIIIFGIPSICFFLLVIGAVVSDNETLEKNNDKTSTTNFSKNQQNESTKTDKSTENIESIESQKEKNSYSYEIEEEDKYQKISVDELEEALEENAAAAKDKYNNKYLEITGRLGVIDSDLKYIELLSTKNEWDLVGVFCIIKTKEQKEVIKKLKKDQKIVVKGKITDVGEVLGYYLNIEEIEGL